MDASSILELKNLAFGRDVEIFSIVVDTVGLDMREVAKNTDLLPIACSNGKRDMCSFLLKNGADANARGETYNKTPLQAAISFGSKDICSLLIEHGANCNHECDDRGFTPLMIAAEDTEDAVGLCRILVNAGADTNAVTYRGMTALSTAVKNNNLELCELLLENEADPMIAETMSRTSVLHVAASKGSFFIVKVLLEYGSDPNHKNIRGETPLHLAARLGNKDVCKLLVENGADPRAKSHFGFVPANVLGETIPVNKEERSLAVQERSLAVQERVELIHDWLKQSVPKKEYYKMKRIFVSALGKKRPRD